MCPPGYYHNGIMANIKMERSWNRSTNHYITDTIQHKFIFIDRIKMDIIFLYDISKLCTSEATKIFTWIISFYTKHLNVRT